MNEQVTERTLRENLARYIDNEAFVAKKIGKARAEHLRNRRERAHKNADAVIRFFGKDGNLERLQAQIERNREAATA